MSECRHNVMESIFIRKKMKGVNHSIIMSETLSMWFCHCVSLRASQIILRRWTGASLVSLDQTPGNTSCTRISLRWAAGMFKSGP